MAFGQKSFRGRGLPTPENAPTGTTQLILNLPDDAAWWGIYVGLISALTEPEAWVQMGSGMSPETAAAIAATVYGDAIEGANVALGTMAYQDADAVNIDGGEVDGTPIGATTPASLIATMIDVILSGGRGIMRLDHNGAAGNAGTIRFTVGLVEQISFLYNTSTRLLAVNDGLASGAQRWSLNTSNGNVDNKGDLIVRGNLGANGAAPGRPSVTGSRGGNAALASLLTKLHNQGYITDATTA